MWYNVLMASKTQTETQRISIRATKVLITDLMQRAEDRPYVNSIISATAETVVWIADDEARALLEDATRIANQDQEIPRGVRWCYKAVANRLDRQIRALDVEAAPAPRARRSRRAQVEEPVATMEEPDVLRTNAAERILVLSVDFVQAFTTTSAMRARTLLNRCGQRRLFGQVEFKLETLNEDELEVMLNGIIKGCRELSQTGLPALATEVTNQVLTFTEELGLGLELND